MTSTGSRRGLVAMTGGTEVCPGERSLATGVLPVRPGYYRVDIDSGHSYLLIDRKAVHPSSPSTRHSIGTPRHGAADNFGHEQPLS
jgi:hypothetical protein